MMSAKKAWHSAMASGALEWPKATGRDRSGASFSIRLAIHWKAAFLPRALPMPSTRPFSMVIMGLMFSSAPTTAEAVEMRPPIFRYFSVSTTASRRRRPASSSSLAASSPAERP